MQVLVNGQLEEIMEGATVSSLIRQHHLAPERVAVEINEDLVPRRRFENTRLHSGDQIEIVTFVGGG